LPDLPGSDDVSAADAAWAAQLGPALTEADVARLLGRAAEAVARAPELLRLQQRESAERVYPLFQFTADGQVPGVADVLAMLSPVLSPLTIASWLTSRNRQLDGARPIDLLRAGGADPVLPGAAARRRRGGVTARPLLSLQHAFAMLLKAALVQVGVPVFDKELGRSLRFEACVKHRRKRWAGWMRGGQVSCSELQAGGKRPVPMARHAFWAAMLTPSVKVGNANWMSASCSTVMPALIAVATT
jgi:hypothetical protein